MDRKQFFSGLQQWPWQQQATIIAGISIMCTARCSRGRPESAAFQDLVLLLHLKDARTLIDPVEDEGKVPDPTEYFTYWGPNAASRLDRFYVVIRSSVGISDRTIRPFRPSA